MTVESLEKKKKEKQKQQSEAKKKQLKINRYFTKPGDDPYDSVRWGTREAVAGDFRQSGVEAPICWSDSAVGIVAKLYFATVNGVRESSVRTLIQRVVKKITDEGINHGYFDEEDSFLFEAELAYILVNQIAAFNTPVWLNVGVPNRSASCSACYLLNVEDTMFGEDSITEWISNESAIFRSGAGAGVNLSKIRGSREKLSTGGIASGPISFMRPADANAGAIKSGGSSRRAAKLVCLDIDHPDILDFINCKVREDKRMKILSENGVNLDPSTEEGEKNIAECTSFQNENISVRISDEFMQVVVEDEPWRLLNRIGGVEHSRIRAKNLLMEIAEAAWHCADPGVMFDDTINKWHTTPSLGRISTSNPCCEVHQNDNTSCNLASLNLVKFLEGNKFLFKRFNQVVDIMITAMDITCSFSELPTKKLEENTRNLRQLGLGYSNLGAALMIQGMPYDSDEGRDWAASVTSLMTARAYRRSAELADCLGPFLYYRENADAMDDVLIKHVEACNSSMILSEEIESQWKFLPENSNNGFRNSQVTVIAPTGTISFMMDCDTTGAEPAYALKTHKKLASGGMIEQDLKCYEIARKEPYDDKVFQTAAGHDSISYQGHLDMVAAIQPHISGAISKTTNLPNNVTADDIYNIYIGAWQRGIKNIAVYRDGSKATQVLSAQSPADETPLENMENIVFDNLEEKLPHDKIFDDQFVALDESRKFTDEYIKTFGPENVQESVDIKQISQDEAKKNPLYKMFPDGEVTREISRRRMDTERKSLTHKFQIGEHEGYITAGMYTDGTLGEIFLSGIGKEGSALRGWADAWAITVSMCLQYGVPLEVLAQKFSHMRFDPEGITANSEIRVAKSIPDYVMRWLVSKFGDEDLQAEMGVMTQSVKDLQIEKFHHEPQSFDSELIKSQQATRASNGRVTFTESGGKLCTCGAEMRRTGTCYSCPECGVTTGCG